MQEYYNVEVPNINRMASQFKNLFVKEDKRDFVVRFQEISRKIEEHRRLVKQLDKQSDKYWHAESEKAKYQFGLDLTINAYRDFTEPKTIFQRELQLNRIKNTWDKLLDKIKKSTTNIKKYHSLLTKEVETRLQIKLLAEFLHSDILIKLMEKTALTDSSCPRRFCVSSAKIMEKFVSRYQLALPKDLTTNERMVKNTV